MQFFRQGGGGDQFPAGIAYGLLLEQPLLFILQNHLIFRCLQRPFGSHTALQSFLKGIADQMFCVVHQIKVIRLRCRIDVQLCLHVVHADIKPQNSGTALSAVLKLHIAGNGHGFLKSGCRLDIMRHIKCNGVNFSCCFLKPCSTFCGFRIIILCVLPEECPVNVVNSSIQNLVFMKLAEIRQGLFRQKCLQVSAFDDLIIGGVGKLDGVVHIFLNAETHTPQLLGIFLMQKGSDLCLGILRIKRDDQYREQADSQEKQDSKNQTNALSVNLSVQPLQYLFHASSPLPVLFGISPATCPCSS